jgi:hypothetical protein
VRWHLEFGGSIGLFCIFSINVSAAPTSRTQSPIEQLALTRTLGANDLILVGLASSPTALQVMGTVRYSTTPSRVDDRNAVATAAGFAGFAGFDTRLTSFK